MTHLDSRLLASYKPLYDEHLRSYFSHERIQAHLRQAGLIGRRGEIISDKEYREKLARRERKKHVRQALAENIVHRAVHMERARQAKLKRHLDMLTKAAVVSNVKGSKRRATGGQSSTNVSKSDEADDLPIHEAWLQARPTSTSPHRDIHLMNEEFDGQSRMLRVRSANVSDGHQRKHPAKSSSFQQRQVNRPKSSVVRRSSSLQSRSQIKPSDAPCQITMVYYGSHTKPEYDHSRVGSTDEIMVMQQHCGGENLIVYKGNHQPGDDFSFNSRRHSDYPLGLSLYVKGFIDSRISTCCEYKHRHGVRLGGERGHFAVVSVQGSKPCLKCRFEQQMRSKELNETEDEEQKPITIALPVSEAKGKSRTPVRIPVKHVAESESNYSDDFDDVEKAEKSTDGYSSNSSRNMTKAQKPPARVHSTSAQGKSSYSMKTWQITFHSSNIPTGSFQLPTKASTNACLKISLLSADGKSESEPYEIDLREHPDAFKSGRQDTFRTTLRDIGQPKQIRLVLQIADDHADGSKWHLDHVELVDLDTRWHYKFSCNQRIRPSQEIRLKLTESFDEKAAAKAPSQKLTTTKQQQRKASSSSSSSSSSSDETVKPIKTTKTRDQRSSSDDEQLFTRYRISIHPSKEVDGNFDAMGDTRIFLRVNNQTKDSFLYTNGTTSCPSFEPGKNQTFEMNLRQDPSEQPTKLTIGYYNSTIMARKWKLQKIILINTKTRAETVFLCREALLRDDLNFRAQRTFGAHSKDDDDHDTRQTNAVRRGSSQSESEKNPRKKNSLLRPLSPPPIAAKRTDDRKSSPVRSSRNVANDASDEDNRTLQNKASTGRQQDDSSMARPKTRRGRQTTLNTDAEQKLTSAKPQSKSDIWRPSTELGSEEPVSPLGELDTSHERTDRSNAQSTRQPPPLSTLSKLVGNYHGTDSDG